jgi:putative FmdB family regulatory protein
MPLYRYQCNSCGAEFEKLMSINEKYDGKTEVACPECQSIDHTPLISKTSFSLRGGGWYKDGYQRGKKE